MYHFDYVGKNGGAVYEKYKTGGMVILNGQKNFSVDEFLRLFVLTDNNKHPFTLTSRARRARYINGVLRKTLFGRGELHEYSYIKIDQIDPDDANFGDDCANLYGFWYDGAQCPFEKGE